VESYQLPFWDKVPRLLRLPFMDLKTCEPVRTAEHLLESGKHLHIAVIVDPNFVPVQAVRRDLKRTTCSIVA